MEKQLTEQQAIEERAKYVAAFNDTMIKIWLEQITLLGVIDTASCCALLSEFALRLTARCRRYICRRLSSNMACGRITAQEKRCRVGTDARSKRKAKLV